MCRVLYTEKREEKHIFFPDCIYTTRFSCGNICNGKIWIRVQRSSYLRCERNVFTEVTDEISFS